jgi:hypothetical protein
MFYKIEKSEFVNSWVSEKLKEYMFKWNRQGKVGLCIPEFESYYRKGGWMEINGYKYSLLKSFVNVVKKGYAINRWSNDVGVVKNKNTYYVISVLTLTKTKWPWVKFPMSDFSRKIYKMMCGLNY